jgi:protein dithiol oxidoreductase (disulfide-forming)
MESQMKRLASLVLSALFGLHSLAALAGADRWIEGRNYVHLNPEQRTSVPPGKVEVMEVFSYGCPACNSFQPMIDKLRESLPSNAQMVYLPASFKPSEDWPTFQRAYFAAQALGIADKAHQAMFDAVWKTGELAIVNPNTNQLKSPQPSLEDVARCYGRLTGVKPADFLQAARSFSVDVKVKAADAKVIAMQVPGTPCIVVNGKYRINMETLANPGDIIDIVKMLVAKESQPARAATAMRAPRST